MPTPNTGTSFDNKCSILADLWLNYRDEEEWQDFVEYNDLGLPLAYAIANGIVESSPMAENFVEEAWSLLLGGLGIDQDAGYSSLDELLDSDVTFSEELVEAIDTASLAFEEEEEEEEISYNEDEVMRIESEAEANGYRDGYQEGFSDGAKAEQKRIQEVVVMQKRWAKENRKGNEFLFWDGVGEVLTPIEIDYSEEAYRRSLEQDGF